MGKAVTGRVWKVEPRNGYVAIDERANGESGTRGNPIILFCGERIAAQLTVDLNDVYSRHGDAAARDLHAYLCERFNSVQGATTQRARFREYLNGPRDDKLNPEMPLGPCRYALACENEGVKIVTIGNTDRKYAICERCDSFRTACRV